jgi:hypothetical protein
MNREAKLISEIISYLINTSNALETVRGKVSRIDPHNFLKAQESLTTSIQHLQRGKSKLDENDMTRGA